MKEPTAHDDKERLSKLQKTWVERIKNAKYTQWEQKAQKVINRYRDDRGNYDGDIKKMNILCQTQRPSSPPYTPALLSLM